jgi:hypothetical protein
MPKTKSQKAADKAFIDKISSITVGPKSGGSFSATVQNCPICGKNHQVKVHAKIMGVGLPMPDGGHHFVPAPGYDGPNPELATRQKPQERPSEEIALSA